MDELGIKPPMRGTTAQNAQEDIKEGKKSDRYHIQLLSKAHKTWSESLT